MSVSNSSTPASKPQERAPRVAAAGDDASAGASGLHARMVRAVSGISDTWAYVTPMALFLIFVEVGNRYDSLYVFSHYARGILAGLALIVFWHRYTPVRWTHLHWGVLMGVVGLFQWIATHEALEATGFSWFQAGPGWDPREHFESTLAMWSFMFIRLVGMAIVVAFMEELFWRDWLWRQLLAPNDFRMAGVGEWHWSALLFTSAAFATVHGSFAIDALIWGLLVGSLLVFTRSLGACIVMHGVTNFLLYLYVVISGEWKYL